MTNEEIAKEIVIAMIQQDKISPVNKNTIEEINQAYTEEVCKAFIAVFKTVNNAPQSIYEKE